MSKITFDYSKAAGFISEEEIAYMSKLTEEAKERLVSGTGAGNDFTGWLDLPKDYDKEEFARIKQAAKKIQSDSKEWWILQQYSERNEKDAGNLLCGK